ncbi:MAG TPA: hypothetical protein V6D11_28300, partial [Waterburya sp.]
QLEAQYQAPSDEPTSELTTSVREGDCFIQNKGETQKMTPVQPTTGEDCFIQNKRETQQMTLEQPTAQPSNSTLATSSRSNLTQASSTNLGLTQQQIQEAVEQQFGKENVETKTAILNYVCKDTFNTAQELQHALAKLRQTKLDILLKLINDHNQAASSDENTLKTALLQASEQRQRETEDFFGSFESQLLEMRAAFGV